ncbi:single-stranded DNA-binding protein [Pantoea agglomerans]|uniref:single-stranded DNA-binding protein n=1 Tax=Pantoea TaxID=53335 RepID=UPI001F164EE8|nr:MULTISPECIES: single-stranded DNA-binding protein [Pantoea]UIL51561.1 single-stranded DNA-binding protein [Pantoea agglomerans]UIL53967.1 single-stranded DNA-binding protein [Pantoea agglomerans]
MPINTITIAGNVGKDAVLRVTPNGKHIASFSLPAKSGFGDNEKTSWLQCKMFGAMAEKLSASILKGAKVTVTGEFVLEEWTKDDGTKVSTPTILVRDIDLPPKQSGQQQSRPQQSHGQSTEPQYDNSIPF